MKRNLRYLAILIAGLAALTLLGYWGVNRSTRRWVEHDIQLRSQLTIHAAKRSIISHWQHANELAALLNDLTRDERLLAAIACTPEGTTIATSTVSPRGIDCATLHRRILSSNGRLADWSDGLDDIDGPLHVSAKVIEGDGLQLGYVGLVHDLAFLHRRSATTRNFMLAAFFLLLATAAVLGVGFERAMLRQLRKTLRRAMLSSPDASFHPLKNELIALSRQIQRDHRVEGLDGAWSPERLKATLSTELDGERILVLANREPYIHERKNNEVTVMHPASGLVTALEPVLRACSGIWIAHGSGSADRETVDAMDRVAVPPSQPIYTLRRVWLTVEEEAGYYYGFANEGLWPLCHVAHARPYFRESDYAQYLKVNERFAAATCDEAAAEDPIILVQDYHFALAPLLIRSQLPQATVVAFWHIPWPNAERVGICPWRKELLEGLLGASIVGFHTQQHCNNFMATADAYLECRIDRDQQAIVYRGRRTLIRPYPISIEWPISWLSELATPSVSRSAIISELALPANALIGVGIDRLDYTKGIEERMQAVDALLERHPQYRGRFVFIQLAAPSRSELAQYRALSERVEALASSINERWGTPGYAPVMLLRKHHDQRDVFRYYRAANLCYVSSLHDGMNLVAKEFIAARDDEQGVLLLSQFTGAARELVGALIVNPYDIAKAAEAFATALEMDQAEVTLRMRTMRQWIAKHNVYRWAGKMLLDAARIREHERFAARLPTTRLESLQEYSNG